MKYGMTSEFDSNRQRFRLSCLLGLGLLLSAPIVLAADSVYVTWAGAEPDKGACAWYIKRVVDPQASFEVVEHGARLPEGTAFDVPQSEFRRTHNASSFQNLLRAYPSDDPVVQKLAALTHDIEINLWRAKVHTETWAIEQRVREIDMHFSPDSVPMGCFIAFFDNVYAWLEAGESDAASLAIPALCTAAAGSRTQAPKDLSSTNESANE